MLAAPSRGERTDLRWPGNLTGRPGRGSRHADIAEGRGEPAESFAEVSGSNPEPEPEVAGRFEEMTGHDRGLESPEAIMQGLDEAVPPEPRKHGEGAGRHDAFQNPGVLPEKLVDER